MKEFINLFCIFPERFLNKRWHDPSVSMCRMSWDRRGEQKQKEQLAQPHCLPVPRLCAKEILLRAPEVQLRPAISVIWASHQPPDLVLLIGPGWDTAKEGHKGMQSSQATWTEVWALCLPPLTLYRLLRLPEPLSSVRCWSY